MQSMVLQLLGTNSHCNTPSVCSTSCSTSFRAVLHSSFLSVAAHFPTWESAVGGFASAGDLRKLRKTMAADPSSLKPPKPEGPRPKRIQPGQFDGRAQGHVLPFPGVHDYITAPGRSLVQILQILQCCNKHCRDATQLDLKLGHITASIQVQFTKVHQLQYHLCMFCSSLADRFNMQVALLLLQFM